MEVWRHISAGRLAEVFGASQLDTDKFIRTLGWRVAAQRDLDAVAPPARAVLDAYTQGVNAWLDSASRVARAGVPRRRRHAGAVDEPRHDRVGQGPGVEPGRQLRLARCSGTWPTRQLGRPGPDGRAVPGLPRRRSDHHPDRPARVGRRGQPAREATAARVRRGRRRPPATRRPSATPQPRPPSPDEAAAWHAVAGLGQGLLQTAGLDAAAGLASDHGIGSNDWVVGPTMSATRGALLANDPHLGISMPSIWYLNGLHCRTVSTACPYDVAGVSFPGVPGVVLGHNARIAWGATNIDPDVQDLVIEKLDPADPGAYLHDGASVPFTVRHEQIKVSGAAPVDLEIRSTVHGPDPQRGRRPPGRRPADGHPLDREPRGGPDVRGHPRPGHGGELRRLPCVAGAVRRARARTSSTPTSTATSATSSRATSRSAPRRRTAAIDRSVAMTAAASGPVACRSTTCPGSSIPWTASWSPPTTPQSTASIPISSPRNGIRAIALSASSTSSRRPGRMA